MDLVLVEQLGGYLLRFLTLDGDTGYGAGLVRGIRLVEGDTRQAFDLLHPMVFQEAQTFFLPFGSDHLVEINGGADGHFRGK